MQETILLGLVTLVAILALCFRFKRKSIEKQNDQQSKQDKTMDPIQKKNKQKQSTDKLVKSEAAEKIQKKKKNKKKISQEQIDGLGIKQLEQKYPEIYYGCLSLKLLNSIVIIDTVSLRNSKLLFSTSKNQLVLYDLKKWKKSCVCQQRYHVSLENNTASAIYIGLKYYYVALKFDKTVCYYEFKGGQNGVYFKQVKKFSRNLYKTDLNSLWVNEQQTFIVGTGSQNDTQIYVWSMNGQKLNQINTCQIEQYQSHYGLDKVIIRGWTTSIKKYTIVSDKANNFSKMQPNVSLNHAEKAQCSSIDNMGLYAVTVSGSAGDNELIKIWKVNQENSTNQKTIDAFKLDIENITHCCIHTLKDENSRLKTIVALANNQKIVLTDRNLKMIDEIIGVSLVGLYMTGTMKNIVLGTHLRNGKFIIWNIKSMIDKIEEFTI